jgi:predicted transcriptional regulator
MVAPSYAMKRQDLAKKIGLGRKLSVAEAEAAVETAPKARRIRRKATAA